MSLYYGNALFYDNLVHYNEHVEEGDDLTLRRAHQRMLFVGEIRGLGEGSADGVSFTVNQNGHLPFTRAQGPIYYDVP